MLFASTNLFAASLLLCGAVAGRVTSAIEHECSGDCSAPLEVKTGSSLIQRSLHSGVLVNVSDLAPKAQNASNSANSSEARFLQLTAMGKNANSEQLAKWEDEVEELNQHLQHRRALLDQLRHNMKQPSGAAVSGDVQASDNAEPDNSYIDDQLIIPVPYYMHDKNDMHGAAHTSGAKHAYQTVSQWYGNIIGDALDPAPANEAEAQEHAEHAHGHIVLLFLFGSLVLGSCLQLALDRYAPIIPYTAGLFVIGSIVAWIHWLNMNVGRRWTSWYDSIEMWQAINPHLLFYVFLPALLFGDVMKLKVQLVTMCFGQIFLLACPGVLIGTALTAMFGRYCLPYGWDWSICFVFGSILAATDPVAVVSLFNSLGVSPRLTMLISGESLINDGTAIVCFALALKVAQGATLLPLPTAYFFVYMLLPSLLIGFSIGFAAVALISFCCDFVGESDAMIQVVVTICCGYLAFFVAENEFSSSGVIATVSAGLAVAHSAWPLFISKETVHIVWEAIEFVGNTVIFFLAGLIFMGTVLERHFGFQDFSWLFTLYFGMTLIRLIMLALLWGPLNYCGQRISGTEGIVMLWSGLRGAVSLAMGMIVDIEPGINSKTGNQVMFHVGGVAALTLLINSVTTGPLLRILGLVNDENLMNRVSSKLSLTIEDEVRKTFEHELHNHRDARFNGANADIVRCMVPMLNPQGAAHYGGDSSEEVAHLPIGRGTHRNMIIHQPHWFLAESVSLELQLGQVFREVFLRVVLSRYWEGIQDGVIPRQLFVSRVLLHSTEEAFDFTGTKLNDWDIIIKKLGLDETLSVPKPTTIERILSRVVDVWPFRMIPQFRRSSLDFQKMTYIFVALSYMEAHAFAQEKIPSLLGRDDPVGVKAREAIVRESQELSMRAEQFIRTSNPEFVEWSKSEMLARRLLRKHIKEVEEKKEAGFLSKAECDHLCELSHKALRKIARRETVKWKDKIFKAESGKLDLSPSSGGGSPALGPAPRPILPRGPAHVHHGHMDALQPGYSPFGDQGAALLPGGGPLLPGVGVGLPSHIEAPDPSQQLSHGHGGPRFMR